MLPPPSSIAQSFPAEQETSPAWMAKSSDRAESSSASYYFALLFLALYFIRPQDWVPGLAGFNIIRPIMLGWIGLLVLHGSKSQLKGWLRTPHDWVILILYGYVAWTAPSEADATTGYLNLIIFYFLTVQTLTSWGLLHGYIKLWYSCLLILAIFGVLQVLGVDITSGKEVTDTFFGRLALGTWLSNNPNALAHTIIVALPLSYTLFFWRGSSAGRWFIFPTSIGMVVWCVIETESKGAFVVGAVLLTLMFVVGRRWWIKFLLLAVAASIGVGALKSLPRMEKMDNLRSDHGVQGRLLAWEQAKMAMEQNPTGVGWKQFMALVDWQEGNYWHTGIPKSTHSSYVQIGAELGKRGLFIWLLVLIVALRATWVFKAQNDTEERVRRSILLMLTGYMISGWMINREYHTEYYLLAAIAAAMHRLNVARAQLKIEDATVEPKALALPWAPPPSWETAYLETLPEEKKAVPSIKTLWNRISWVDLTVAFSATWAVIEFWDYILKNL